MVEKVIWMPIAIEVYQQIIEFLLIVWNEEIVEEFEFLTKESINKTKSK